MQEILGILAQSRPAAGVETVVYTVPKNRRAVVSRLFIFNNSGGNAIIDLSFVPGGSGNIVGNPTALENTLLNQFTLATKQGNTDANNIAGGGLTFNEYDDIRLETDVLGVVAHVFGEEIIPDEN